MDFRLSRGQQCMIWVDVRETEAVKIAASNLAKDLERTLNIVTLVSQMADGCNKEAFQTFLSVHFRCQSCSMSLRIFGCVLMAFLGRCAGAQKAGICAAGGLIGKEVSELLNDFSQLTNEEERKSRQWTGNGS